MLILVVNPGSSSRKYALYEDTQELASVHFEKEENRVVCALKTQDGKKQDVAVSMSDVAEAVAEVAPILTKYKLPTNFSAIAIRVVAPSAAFARDRLLDDATIAELERIQNRAPLHITGTLGEVRHIKQAFPSVPLVLISDSAFHQTKPAEALYYGFSTELADKYDIKRYGYHGLSVRSAVESMKDHDMLLPKVIVCHLGSGSSISAVADGASVENSMGYSPLEGLMMATRSGSLDLSAALVLKHELSLSDDQLEEFLNKKAGLLGVSGSSNDIRELLKLEEAGDEHAKLALDILVYRIRGMIGQMAASMHGVSAIVFTGTVGERSAPIRQRIIEGLDYLGFALNDSRNESAFEPREIEDISGLKSKPILIIPTNEGRQMALQAVEFMQNQ